MKTLTRSFLLLLLLSAFLQSTSIAEPPIKDQKFSQDYRDPFIRVKAESEDPGRGRRRRFRNSENSVRSIAVDNQDRIWATTAKGLKVASGTELVDPEGWAVEGSTYDVWADDDGTLWIGAWNGLFKVTDGKLSQENGMQDPTTLIKRTAGRLFACTPRGLFELKAGQWELTPGPWATNIYDVAVAGDDLYIASWSGLYRVSGGKAEWLHKPDQALSRRVSSLVVDKNGHVWIGNRGGIDVYRNGKRGPVVTPQQGLPSTDVRCLALSPDAELWVGTGIGAARYDGKNWSFRNSLRWLPGDEVSDIDFLKDGSTVVATSGGISVLRSREMTLEEKADYYQDVVRARHVRPPGLVERCRLPIPGDVSKFEPMDTDNDGLFTGLYLAAESYRWAVTGAEDAKANAQEAFRGMETLQTVTGTPGFVARTVIPTDWQSMADANRTYTDEEAADHWAREARWKKMENRWRESADGKWLWKGDTSSDEMSGHFFCYPIYYDLVADDAEKKRVAGLVQRIMDHIIEGGYVFRDIDGEATRWGVWSPEKLNNDPNWWMERGGNSVEILAYLTITKHVTGDEKYDREIEKLLHEHGYAENILEPMRPGNDYFTYIGYHLLSLCYPALMTYEKNPERLELYRRSMDAWYAPVRRDGSPMYGFVYAAFTKGDANLPGCAKLLRQTPLDQIQYSVNNSRREDIKIVGRPVQGLAQTEELLPADERAVFRWDRNVYMADHGAGGSVEGSGVFWLLPYWMGRYYDIVAPPVQ